MGDVDIVIGIVIGGIIAILFGLLFNPLEEQRTIEKVFQYQEDCKAKEFYYMDSHRAFCDRIEASPGANSTAASS